ncbi:hypothetical protein [Novosphingobium lindaniclasticum]|uniref:hypothetical protein n=1 Tax=Novosphingobium lindaniclasticum TaxID=1329895 RepID=UPI00142F727C|nr:hypothetical protein [Novosphingobium lindaniclasticum]
MAAIVLPIFRDRLTDAPLAAICVVNDMWLPSNGDPEFRDMHAPKRTLTHVTKESRTHDPAMNGRRHDSLLRRMDPAVAPEDLVIERW